jgi:hypothetical protein
MFSLGIALAHLITRRTPGSSTDGGTPFLQRSARTKFQFSEEDLAAAIPESCPGSLSMLTSQCCAYEAEDRPSAQDAVEWLAELLVETGEDEVARPTLPLPPLYADVEGPRASGATVPVAASKGNGGAQGFNLPAQAATKPMGAAMPGIVETGAGGDSGGEGDDGGEREGGDDSKSFEDSGAGGDGGGGGAGSGTSIANADRGAGGSAGVVPRGGDGGDSGDGVLCEGWLVKQGKLIKSWKRRWFRLDKSSIQYYKSDQAGARAQGTISLKDVVQPSGQYTERAKIVAKPHCLILHTRQRTYFFAAETEEELERWMKAISEATTKCNGQ